MRVQVRVQVRVRVRVGRCWWAVVNRRAPAPFLFYPRPLVSSSHWARCYGHYYGARTHFPSLLPPAELRIGCTSAKP